MIRDRHTSRFIVIMVLTLTLSHRTTGGGSWKRLERLFQDRRSDENFDENRIIFPDMRKDFNRPSWRSTTTQRYDDTDTCQSHCHISREYSPVCGTNGVTYQNMDQLQCAIRCGVAVDLHRLSPCSNDVPPISTAQTPPVTTTTTSPLIITTTRRSEQLERCIRDCPTTPEYNPVCGSNRVTYFNVGKMQCEKICGVDVNLWRHARCPTISTTTTISPNSEDNKNVEDCIRNCPTTPGYNPVCGTDDVTYNNYERLECAKLCGIDVSIRKPGRCTYDYV